MIDELSIATAKLLTTALNAHQPNEVTANDLMDRANESWNALKVYHPMMGGGYNFVMVPIVLQSKQLYKLLLPRMNDRLEFDRMAAEILANWTRLTLIDHSNQSIMLELDASARYEPEAVPGAESVVYTEEPQPPNPFDEGEPDDHDEDDGGEA